MIISVRSAINKIYELISKFRIVDSPDIFPVTNSNGTELRLRGGSVAGGGGGSISDNYKGPFKIVKKEDSDTVVTFYRTPDASIIFIGADIFAITVVPEITITETCYLYLHAYNDGGAILYEFIAEPDVLEPDETNYYVTLAYIEFSDSKISEIDQYHYGHVYISGRVI